MRSQPKAKADSGRVWQTEEGECDHGKEAELLERLSLEEKPGIPREQESVDEMVARLRKIGCSSERIQMEVEIKYGYLAKKKIENMRESAELPQEESEE